MGPVTHYRTAWGPWGVGLLQPIASLHGGSAQWNSCNALPHRLGQCAMEVLQCTPSLPGGYGRCNLVQYTATLPGPSGPWIRAAHCLSARVSGHWNSCNALPRYLGAMGSGSPAMHCFIAWHWALELLQCIAKPPWGNGHPNSTMHYLTA